MKLYVCYGTFGSPRPPAGTLAGNAYHALKDAGYDPGGQEGLRLGARCPTSSNTRTRKEIKQLHRESRGRRCWSPTTGEVDERLERKIVAWAKEHPATGTSGVERRCSRGTSTRAARPSSASARSPRSRFDRCGRASTWYCPTRVCRPHRWSRSIRSWTRSSQLAFLAARTDAIGSAPASSSCPSATRWCWPRRSPAWTWCRAGASSSASAPVTWSPSSRRSASRWTPRAAHRRVPGRDARAVGAGPPAFDGEFVRSPASTPIRGRCRGRCRW